MNLYWVMLIALVIGWWALMVWLAKKKIAKLAEIAERLGGSTWDKGTWTGARLEAGASGSYGGRVVEVSTRDEPKIRSRTNIELTYKEPSSVGRLNDARIAEVAQRLDLSIPAELKAVGGQFYLDRIRAGWKASQSLPEIEVILALIAYIDHRAAELERVANSK